MSRKAESLVDEAAQREFEACDFAALTLLAADQAGMSVNSQAKLKVLLDDARECQCYVCLPKELAPDWTRDDRDDGPPDGEAWSGGFAENH